MLMNTEKRKANAWSWAEALRKITGSVETTFTDAEITAVSTPEETVVTVKPVIETYFNPHGMIGGSNGCFVARLRDRPGLWEAGIIAEAAVRQLAHSAMIDGMAQTKPEDFYIMEIKAPYLPFFFASSAA